VHIHHMPIFMAFLDRVKKNGPKSVSNHEREIVDAAGDPLDESEHSHFRGEANRDRVLAMDERLQY